MTNGATVCPVNLAQTDRKAHNNNNRAPASSRLSANNTPANSRTRRNNRPKTLCMRYFARSSANLTTGARGTG